MRKNSLLVLPAMVSVMLLGSCGGLGKLVKNMNQNAAYTVEPETMEVHGDSIAITMTGKIPAKTFNNKAIMRINPVIKYGSQEVKTGEMFIQGKKAKTNYKPVIDAKTGGRFTYTAKVAYKPEMSKAELFANVGVKLKASELVPFTDLVEKKVADGTITTALSVRNEMSLMVSDDKYESAKVDTSIMIYYLIHSKNFNPNFSIKNVDINNKNEIEKLKKFFKNPAYKLKSMNITSYASPDGPLDINTPLSAGRTVSTYTELKRILSKAGHQEVRDDNFFVKESIAEDMDGWKKMVELSKLSDKQAILDILNNSSLDAQAKENMIKTRHAKSFDLMRTQILPKLRKSKVTVIAETSPRTLEQIKTMAIDVLSTDEEMYLAQNTSTLAGKMEIYQHFATKYPQDWRGHNNVGVVLSMMGKHKEAEEKLNKAASLSPNNGIVNNNLGVVLTEMKKYTEAEEKFTSAKGVNVSSGLSVLNIKKGKYASAVSNLSGNKCNYNAALANTLKGDYTEANNCINCIKPEKMDAGTYYLRAIIGARTANVETMTTNLTRAIMMDSSFRTKAKEDLEFKKYWESVEFKNAIR